MSKIIFITGATSGIGKATAEIFAKNGWNLIINGRRKDRLDGLASTLSAQYKVKIQPSVFDVCNRDETEKNINSLTGEWKKIDVLLNNAGLAVGLNPVDKGLFEDWDRMLNTNIKGLLNVTRFIAPIMINNGKGQIVNVGSIAGREVYPNGNVYCATKHAVDALTKGMRMDFLKYGIKVSQVAPGAVETEFSTVRFKGDKNRADAVYEGYQPLKAEDIADVVFYICNTPAHVCINDILVMPLAQACAGMFNRR